MPNTAEAVARKTITMHSNRQDRPLLRIACRPRLHFASVFARQKMNHKDWKYLYLCVFVSLWSKSQSMPLKSVKSHKVLKENLRFMVQSKQVFYRAKVNCLRVVNSL